VFAGGQQSGGHINLFISRIWYGSPPFVSSLFCHHHHFNPRAHLHLHHRGQPVIVTVAHGATNTVNASMAWIFFCINWLWLLASAFPPPTIFLIEVLVSASPLLQLEQILRVGISFLKPL
jgi:hypothetical protein